MNNLKRAEAIINNSNPTDLDLLVLPEMAFTGGDYILLLEVGADLLQVTTLVQLKR